MPALVEIDTINKHFGDLHVLKNVSTSVEAGEVVVVIGPSGSGKSTLCRAINRLETIDDGEIRIDGTPLPAEGRALAQLRSDVGMVFQAFNLFAHKTVLENVTLGPRKVRRLSKSEADEKGMALLDRVGVANQAHKMPAQLSGGQQQRVAIARVLAQQPSVILADEPVASLDPPTAHMVMRDLQRINRELGITTIVNLHFLDLAREFGDRIIGMRAGKVVFDGSGAEADDAVFERIYGRSLTNEDVLGVDDVDEAPVSVTADPDAAAR